VTARFAIYDRVSGDERQDPSLSLPSQQAANERKVVEWNGEVACVFSDVMTGARDDRPGWSALIDEARNRHGRRFDYVCCYSTSRLSRDRVSAALYERELRRLGVQVYYAMGGAADPSSPEGELMTALQQAIDSFERQRLKRETRRGLRETALQGYWAGGRPPYGYALERVAHPIAARARAGNYKTRLIVNPEQAPHVVWMYDRFVTAEWGTLQIAEDLNRRGIPSPGHTDTRRNIRRVWSKSTVRAILSNPTYCGFAVWDKLSYSDGVPRPRPESEWVRSEVPHPALISQATFAAAQARWAGKRRARNGLPRKARPTPFVLSGHVKCASGHQPLAMFGSTVKGRYHYMRCDYGRQHGREAAEAIPGHGQWCSVREDLLMGFVLDFFERRVFGEARMDLLVKQLDQQERRDRKSASDTEARLRRQIADLDLAIERQVIAIEQDVDPVLVGRRIAKLKDEKATAEAALREQEPNAQDGREELADALERLPDLSEQLRSATPEVQRQVFDAFSLRVEYDRTQEVVRVSATVTEQVARALASGQLDPASCTGGYGPCRNRTCNLGLKRPLLCRLS
jgi:site-specific DNA recombinase